MDAEQLPLTATHPAWVALAAFAASAMLGCFWAGSTRIGDMTISEVLTLVRRKLAWLQPGWRWRLFNVITYPARLVFWLTLLGPFLISMLGTAAIAIGQYISGNDRGNQAELDFSRRAHGWWRFWMLTTTSPWKD